MLKSISSFFMSIVILIALFFYPDIPQQKSVDELSDVPNFFKKFDVSNELYVINNSAIKSEDEMHLVICLQGIVSKTKPSIYVKNNSMYSSYIDEIEKSGVKIIYTDENGEYLNVKSLLNKFKDYITDNGYVLYRASPKAEGLNMATNLSALFGWLAVPESLSDLAVEAGLELKEDFSDDEYNIFFQWKFFNKYKDLFNQNAVVHENYQAKGLRDLAIQQGFFTFYIDEDEDGVWFRNLVFNHTKNNSLVLGWAKYEVEYVTNASKNGDMVIPTDHCYNNSYLTSFSADLPGQKHTETTQKIDETKHYCAILFSDGDNVQWIQNGFSEFYKRQNLKTEFPMTWTFPPLLQEMSPLTFKKVYEDSDENDYFIAGVSGSGYIHPSEYPFDALTEFTEITASQMLNSNLEYVTILDSTPENEFDEFKLLNSLEYYARCENIKGGVLYLDPGRYAGGEGKLYFVNDKPFLCTRFSLWHPGNEMNGVDREWLDQQVSIINSYDADIHSVNGYSVINIHPWSISIDNLEYFVNQLDEDVELVTVDELLKMISENVSHQNAEIN